MTRGTYVPPWRLKNRLVRLKSGFQTMAGAVFVEGEIVRVKGHSAGMFRIASRDGRIAKIFSSLFEQPGSLNRSVRVLTSRQIMVLKEVVTSANLEGCDVAEEHQEAMRHYLHCWVVRRIEAMLSETVRGPEWLVKMLKTALSSARLENCAVEVEHQEAMRGYLEDRVAGRIGEVLAQMCRGTKHDVEPWPDENS